MGYVKLKEEHLQDIAAAIRDKLSVQTTFKPGQMAAAIESIPRDAAAEYVYALNQAVFAPYWCKTPAAYVQRDMQVSLDGVNRTFASTWLGGDHIGFRNYNLFPVALSPDLHMVRSLHYKITTGSRSYDTSMRFAPGIGILKETNIVDAMKGTEINADRNPSWWQTLAYTTTRSSVIEGSLDLTSLTELGWLVIFGAGWDCVWSEIYFE